MTKNKTMSPVHNIRCYLAWGVWENARLCRMIWASALFPFYHLQKRFFLRLNLLLRSTCVSSSSLTEHAPHMNITLRQILFSSQGSKIAQRRSATTPSEWSIKFAFILMNIDYNNEPGWEASEKVISRCLNICPTNGRINNEDNLAKWFYYEERE